MKPATLIELAAFGACIALYWLLVGVMDGPEHACLWHPKIAGLVVGTWIAVVAGWPLITKGSK